MLTVERYRTKTEMILETLRARIISGDLMPGARLILREIGTEFASSEIPVREALRTLAAEEMVVITPHGGARVAQLHADEIVELTETRRLIEPTATVYAAAVMPQASIDKLKQMIERMHRLIDGMDSGDYSRLNREFHREILRHCPNRRMAQFIEDLWTRAERGRVVHRLLPGHVATSLQQHEEIVACIERRDLDALKPLAEIHCEHGLAAVRRLAEDESLFPRSASR
jgi:DNA-binding GntR family transcriptional regulator